MASPSTKPATIWWIAGVGFSILFRVPAREFE
jgi:hypothetical protein